MLVVALEGAEHNDCVFDMTGTVYRDLIRCCVCCLCFLMRIFAAAVLPISSIGGAVCAAERAMVALLLRALTVTIRNVRNINV